MEAELAALAVAGASALVGAMATDAWRGAKTAFARLFGRGNTAQEQRMQVRLEEDAAKLAGVSTADRDRIQQELFLAWRTRLSDLLDDSPDLVAELRSLTGQLQSELPAIQQTWVQENIAHDTGVVYGVQGGGTQIITHHSPGVPVQQSRADDAESSRPETSQRHDRERKDPRRYDPPTFEQRVSAERSGVAYGWQGGTHIHLPPPAPPPTPLELPLDTSGFTGRSGEMAELDGLLDSAEKKGSTAVVISAVSGTAGVGKTALAVHWAHHAISRFPDGSLYVDLRGYDFRQPLQPTDALVAFLLSLGVHHQDIPPQIEHRVKRYRTLMAARCMLVVLDNAHDAEQVRDLLPGARSCFVLVTSRDSLSGLVVKEGARRIDLDVLPVTDAMDLLQTLVGDRVTIERAAAAHLAEQCARLPLALRIAAELAVRRPTMPLGKLVDELRDEQRLLDRFDVGADPRTAVRAVFSWSYRHLPADAARLFRLIGLQPGLDTDAYASGAVADLPPDEAVRLLDVLVRAHLLQEGSPGRFRMHDLLRAYARERADEEAEEVRHAAVTRLLDYYLATTATAARTLLPAERHRRLDSPVIVARMPMPSVSTATTARAWLDAERPNIVAAIAYATIRGWPEYACLLSEAARRYLEVGAHYADALVVHRNALQAAREIEDRVGEAAALHSLGLVNEQLGRYNDALVQHDQALRIYRDIQDRAGEATALGNLGILHGRWAHYEQASDYLDRALTFFAEIGDRSGQALMLANLGLVHYRWARYETSLDHFQRARILYREMGDQGNEAIALGHAGVAHERMGRPNQALVNLQEALSIFRQIGHRVGQAGTLDNLGMTLSRLGRHDEALGYLGEALAICRQVGYRGGEVAILNNEGDALRSAGHSGAVSSHNSALLLARELGDRYEEGRALSGIAYWYAATGDRSTARQYWQEAYAIFSELKVPEAEEIDSQLAAIADHDC